MGGRGEAGEGPDGRGMGRVLTFVKRRVGSGCSEEKGDITFTSQVCVQNLVRF